MSTYNTRIYGNLYLSEINLYGLSTQLLGAEENLKRQLMGLDNQWNVDQRGYNGFVNGPTGVAITYSPTNRTITIVYTGQIVYYNQGKKYTVSGTVTSPAHTATDGIYYFYYVGSTLTTGATYDTITMTPVCYVYYNYDQNVIAWDPWFTPAARGITMVGAYRPVISCDMRRIINAQLTTYLYSGGAINNAMIGRQGDVNYDISSSVIYSQDLQITVAAISKAATAFQIFYKVSSSGWRFADSTSQFLFKNGNICANVSNVMTELTNGQYVNMYSLATTSGSIIWIHGQHIYTTETDAQTEEFDGLDFNGFPFQHYAALYQVTYKLDSGGNAATGRAQIETYKYLTGREANPIMAQSSSSNHSLLTNRSDVNSHPITAIKGTNTGAVIFNGTTGLTEDSTFLYNTTTGLTKTTGDLAINSTAGYVNINSASGLQVLSNKIYGTSDFLLQTTGNLTINSTTGYVNINSASGLQVLSNKIYGTSDFLLQTTGKVTINSTTLNLSNGLIVADNQVAGLSTFSVMDRQTNSMLTAFYNTGGPMCEVRFGSPTSTLNYLQTENFASYLIFRSNLLPVTNAFAPTVAFMNTYQSTHAYTFCHRKTTVGDMYQLRMLNNGISNISGINCDIDGYDKVTTYIVPIDPSSRDIKENILSLTDTYAEQAYSLDPKTYNYKNGRCRKEIGFIAEDADSLGFEELVEYIAYDKNGKIVQVGYNDKGITYTFADGTQVKYGPTDTDTTESTLTWKPRGLRYQNFTVILLKLVQKQKTLIDNLTTRVTALERTLTNVYK